MPTNLLRRSAHLVRVVTASSALLFSPLFLRAQTPPDSSHPPQGLHNLLSQSRLTPPLRAPILALHYSPDGKYLMLQDTGGVFLISRDPLKVLVHIKGPNMYEAQFSADSQSLTTVTLPLSYSKWNLVDGHKIEDRILDIPSGCLDGAISPDGAFFACVLADLSFGLYDLSAAKWAYFTSETAVPDRLFAKVPYGSDTAYPGPLGFFLSSVAAQFTNRGIVKIPVQFSPDGKTLIAANPTAAFRLDILAKKKESLPTQFQKKFANSIALLDSSRALVAAGKDSELAILSLADATAIQKLSRSADRARTAAGNPRYALLYNNDAASSTAILLDLQRAQPLDLPQFADADVRTDAHGSEIAAVTNEGDLLFFHLGENHPIATLPLPLDRLPILRGAALDPQFTHLLLSIDNRAANFDLASGRRLATIPAFSAAKSLDASATLLVPQQSHSALPQLQEIYAPPVDEFDQRDTRSILLRPPPNTAQLLRVDNSAGSPQPAWLEDQDAFLRASSSQLFEYSATTTQRGHFLLLDYRLRALEIQTGKELWTRFFNFVPPVPFINPQSDSIVFGWLAQSEAAHAAAARDPRANASKALKSATLSPTDSFFEILDGASGKTRAGVLVQAGSGPHSFDAVFTAADTLFVVKDSIRVSLYDIPTGKRIAQLTGSPIAASAAGLFAVGLGSNRLAIYDLKTAALLDQQTLAEDPVILQFSPDGSKLLALTHHQIAYLFDLTQLRTKSPPTPSRP